MEELRVFFLNIVEREYNDFTYFLWIDFFLFKVVCFYFYWLKYMKKIVFLKKLLILIDKFRNFIKKCNVVKNFSLFFC